MFLLKFSELIIYILCYNTKENESGDYMKYIYQFLIITSVTFLGELCHELLPLPIPSSVYGMIIMFICLLTKVIKEEQIKETADFLLLIMPIMFIGPSVGVMENYLAISSNIIEFVLVVLITTIVIMIVTGVVSEKLLKRGKDYE